MNTIQTLVAASPAATAAVVLMAGCSAPRPSAARRPALLHRLLRLRQVRQARGLLINVPRRPANAADRLTLDPGDTATAEVQPYAIDTSTGDTCPCWGNVVVSPPNDYLSHPLSADLPICSATISSVD